MQVKPYNEQARHKQWDSSKEQFFKYVTTVTGGGLRIYEGGYLAFDASGDRETNRTYWLRALGIHIGTPDELPVEIMAKLCTPDGEPVSKADLCQGDQQILLCDTDHRIAVALDGYYKSKRNPKGERVYWPSPTARPISNYTITVSRANRKTANLMKQRAAAAADTLWATMQVMGLARAPYQPSGWEGLTSMVYRGKVTGEELLEKYLPDPSQMVWAEKVIRANVGAISELSRDVTVVDYLKF